MYVLPVVMKAFCFKRSRTWHSLYLPSLAVVGPMLESGCQRIEEDLTALRALEWSAPR